MAAPIHTSHISLPESLTVQVPERPHRAIFTTVLTTNVSRPDPAYFGLDPTAAAPRTILTTEGKDEEEPEFLSLKYYSVIQRGGQEEYVVKILSEEKLSDETLERLFGSEGVKWAHVHEVRVPHFFLGSMRVDDFLTAPPYSGRHRFLHQRSLSLLSSSTEAFTTSTPSTL